MPLQRPLTMFGRYFARSSSVAWASIAVHAPWVSPGSRLRDMLAEVNISSMKKLRVSGRPCPPYSGLAETPSQPASRTAR